MQQQQQASSGGGYAYPSPLPAMSGTNSFFPSSPQQDALADAFSSLSMHVPPKTPAVPQPPPQFSSSLSPALSQALSDSFNALLSSTAPAPQQEQQHKSGEVPAPGSSQDQGFSFISNGVATYALSVAQSEAEFGGASPLPPLIQVDSISMGSQQPAAPVQGEASGGRQANSSSASLQYSLIDGYGVQPSAAVPAPVQQQGAVQAAAVRVECSSAQTGTASYGAPQASNVQQHGSGLEQYGNPQGQQQLFRDDRASCNLQQQGSGSGHHGNPLPENQQFRDDRGSNSSQQQGDPALCNQQFRDDRGASNLQHMSVAGQYVSLAAPNPQFRERPPMPQYPPPPQPAPGQPGQQQQQGSVSGQYGSPPPPANQQYRDDRGSNSLQQGPAAMQQGGQPAASLQYRDERPSIPQYAPFPQAAPGQHVASNPPHPAAGQEAPPQHPAPNMQQYPAPAPVQHQSAQYAAPPPVPPGAQGSYPPQVSYNAAAKLPYPPHPSEPVNPPPGVPTYPPQLPSYPSGPTTGPPRTLNQYPPYPPPYGHIQPSYPPNPPPYGMPPSQTQPPYPPHVPPYVPGQDQQNHRPHLPLPPAYPPGPSPHPQGPSLGRSPPGSYVPPYQLYSQALPAQQNFNYGPGAPPPPPYPPNQAFPPAASGQQNSNFGPGVPHPTYVPHHSQGYAPGGPANIPAGPSYERSFSLEHNQRPASPSMDRMYSGYGNAGNQPGPGSYGTHYIQSGSGYEQGKGSKYDQPPSGNYSQGRGYDTRLYDERAFDSRPFEAPAVTDRYNEKSAYEKSAYDNAGFANSEVSAYDGGRGELYGARGSGPSGAGLKSASFSSYRESGGSKLVQAVPKTQSDDVGGGIQKYRVKLLSDSSFSGPNDVICQIGLDGVKMFDPSTNRLLRVYPLDTITKWEVNEPSVFTFWSKSAVDVEQRTIRLQSSSYTTTAILDTLTAACIQLSEMVGRDGRTESTPSSAPMDANSAKKSSFTDWIPIKPRTQPEEKQHWVPDDAVKKCTACDADFGVVNRRHHCRNCGDLFCDKCTRGRTPLNNDEDSQIVRVCDRCLAEVTQRLSNTEATSKPPPPRTHEDLSRKLQEELARSAKNVVMSNSSNGNREQSSGTSVLNCSKCGSISLVTGSNSRCQSCGAEPSNSRSSGRESKSSMYPEAPQTTWSAPSSTEKSGGRMKEVACPTCTVHLQVQVPSYGSETMECSVCQHPFLVHAN